ncbi:MAG: hypothetical protein IT532_14905 [Burkholderiales bacterium]|nr:hypothetical protein [Burkholderiales bacterium]
MAENDSHPPMPDVPRAQVHRVVQTMMRDTQVRWVAIVFQDANDTGDLFTITPYVADPTTGGA